MTSSPPPRRSRTWIMTLLLLAAIAGLPLWGLGALFMSGPQKETKTVVVPHGASVREIAALLDKNDTVRSPLAFRVGAKFLAGNQLQAGEYELAPGESAADIIIKMHDGESVVHWFKVAEGLSSAEVVNLLRNSPALAGDVPIPPEGSLLPETYRYSYGDTRASIIARMQKAMQDDLSDLWTKRDMNVPLKSPGEAVVMASIVEKETGKAAERPRIAEVFYNRLRHSMRLQSDPTVIYAITQVRGPLNRDLTHDDLAFPSPYNTYMSDGLPPHPICNPGKAALEAALHPEQNDFLYFVADGTGGHVFAKDLAEHNQNVTKWVQIKK